MSEEPHRSQTKLMLEVSSVDVVNGDVDGYERGEWSRNNVVNINYDSYDGGEWSRKNVINGDVDGYEGEEWSQKDVKVVDGDGNERGEWSRKFDYMLSMVGFCVGLGNLWRFPYLCNRNGGGAFLIPFVLFLLVCGLPMFFMEVAIAQFSGKGASHVWEICPLFRGLGIGMTIVSWMINLYYNTIVAWCIYYIIRSCSATLPWTTCDNWWNTPFCYVNRDVANDSNTDNTTVDNITMNVLSVNNASIYHTSFLAADMRNSSSVYSMNIVSGVGESSVRNQTFLRTSVEEFWQYNTLRISRGLEETGQIQWHLTLCLLAAWTVVFFCLIRGVRSVGKVVYVTATLPYVLLTVLLIRGLTLPGAMDGVLYYLKPDFSKLLEIQVWLEACLQVFYSLGPAWGGLITMASYNKFNNNCLRDSIIVVFISEGTSVFAGFVIFTVLGVMAHNQGVHVSEVVSSGPGLGFVAYPEALSQLPVPQLWSFIFFSMLLIVGLDTQFVNSEVVITSLLDTFPRILLKRRVLLTAILCASCFLIALPLCCNGGIYIFQLVDWYVAALIPILGVLECFIISWIYGFYRLDKDVEMMIGRTIPRIFKILLSTITPLVLIVGIVLTLSEYKTPAYGDYEYPWYSAVYGWMWASLPVIPIPVMMVYELYKAEGSCMKRLMKTLTPSRHWQPNSSTLRDVHRQQRHAPPSLWKSLKSAFR